MTRPILCYNPHDESHETLEAILVGRGALLDEILADLRQQSSSASRQHWLLRAPRGFGKTHVLGLIYHRVRRDTELSQAYLPLWLGEAEAYGLYSTGMFLHSIAQNLIKELQQAGDNEAPAIAMALEQISATGDDPLLFEEICEILKRATLRRKQVLLVLLDNFHAFLQGFAPKKRRGETERLRSLLSEQQELLVIVATPATQLREVSNAGEPLFGQFRTRQLAKLEEHEVSDLLLRLARATGDTERERLFAEGVDCRARSRVVHRMTGGSPRSVVIAYSAISGARGIAGLVDELRGTLDSHTPYFEARLANLAPRERAIVDALALSEQNLGLQEIAAAARLPERPLSTQVQRLVEEGFAAPVDGQTGKDRLYELTDGLFRIWYRYRKGRRELEPLVRFLAFMNREEELAAALSEVESARGSAIAPAERDRYATTELHLRSALEFARSERGRQEREALWREAEVRPSSVSEGQPEEESEVRSLLGKGVALVERGQPAEAIEYFDLVIANFSKRPEKSFQEAVAGALFTRGLVLDVLGQLEDAIGTYDVLVERFSETPDLPFLVQVARALVNKGVTLGRLGRLEEAMGTYDLVLERCQESSEVSLLDQAARALSGKAQVFGALERLEDEIETYNVLVDRFSHGTDLRLLRQVAGALLNRGIALGELGRPAEAIENYDLVLERFSQRSELPLLETVARSLLNKGVALGELGRHSAAIENFDIVVERFSHRSELGLLEQVSRVLVNKGFALGELGRREEAIGTLDLVLKRFSERSEQPFPEQMALALFNKASYLGELGRFEDAIETYDLLIQRFSRSPELILLECVAGALVNKGIALGELGRLASSIESFDLVLERFSQRSELPLLQRVAGALLNKGVALSELGRFADAIGSFDAVLGRLSQRYEPAFLEHVAFSLVNKGLALGKLGRPADAIESFDLVLERFSQRSELALLEQVARAFINKATALATVGRPEEAIKTYDLVVERFSQRSELLLVEQVARALLWKGRILSESARYREAVTTLRAATTHAQNVSVGFGFYASVALAEVLALAGWSDEARAKGHEALLGVTAGPGLGAYLGPALETLLSVLDLESLRPELSRLGESEGTGVRETARLYEHVADVLLAEGAGRGRVAARRRALSLIPPELRATVNEVAKRIMEGRKRIPTSTRNRDERHPSVKRRPS